MENDISINSSNQIEVETSTINFRSNNIKTNKDNITNSQKNKKKKNKISLKKIDIIQLQNDNFSNFSQENSYYKFVGKSIFLFMNKNDDPLLIIGPDWPFVAFLFSIFNFFYVLIIIKFWIRFSLFSKCVNQITYWSFLISFLYTSFINQGYPKNSICRKTGNPSDEYYYCEQCHLYNYIYNSINHCNKCGICIEGQEHHCVWIGKCVGKNNIFCFYLFIFSTIFSLFYIIFSLQKIF